MIPRCTFCAMLPASVDIDVRGERFGVCLSCQEGLCLAADHDPNAVFGWECVHLWACHVWRENTSVANRDYNWRHDQTFHVELQDRLDRHVLRELCPCPRCRVWRVGGQLLAAKRAGDWVRLGQLLAGPDVPGRSVFAEWAASEETRQGTIDPDGRFRASATGDLKCIESLPVDDLIYGTDGELRLPKEEAKRLRLANRDGNASPPVKPGSLRDLALKKVQLAGPPGPRDQRLNEDQREVRRIEDRLQRAYWRDYTQLDKSTPEAKFAIFLRDAARRRQLCAAWEGFHPEGGYYDGPYWVELSTGECHVIPELPPGDW